MYAYLSKIDGYIEYGVLEKEFNSGNISGRTKCVTICPKTGEYISDTVRNIVKGLNEN
jgi:hypothetical protein